MARFRSMIRTRTRRGKMVSNKKDFYPNIIKNRAKYLYCEIRNGKRVHTNAKIASILNEEFEKQIKELCGKYERDFVLSEKTIRQWADKGKWINIRRKAIEAFYAKKVREEKDRIKDGKFQEDVNPLPPTPLTPEEKKDRKEKEKIAEMLNEKGYTEEDNYEPTLMERETEVSLQLLETMDRFLPNVYKLLRRCMAIGTLTPDLLVRLAEVVGRERNYLLTMYGLVQETTDQSEDIMNDLKALTPKEREQLAKEHPELKAFLEDSK